MNFRIWQLSILAFIFAAPLLALQPDQEPKKEKEPGKKEFGKKDFPFGGPGFGPGVRRKLVPQFDKDGDGRLNTAERAAAREFIKKQGGGGGKGFGGKGKGGFGPNFAKAILDTLDADKDGKLSKPEWLAGVKKFFADSDKDKTGTLSETQVADSLNRIIPPPAFFPKDGPKDKGGPKDKDGPKGKGGPFGFGPARPMASEVLKRADVKKNGKVTLDELTTAAETLFNELDKNKTGKLDEPKIADGIAKVMPPPMFGGGPFGKGGGRDPAKPGPKVEPKDVRTYPDHKLYDTTILRTIFIDFDNKTDWEAELADFYHSDVEVPAAVTVDGKKYANVGVHFRGNTSYMMAGTGYKHSLNLSFDFVDAKQRLLGYKTLNLLNCADDPTMMHSVLYCNIARKYTAAPQANFVKVVINGESWGIFANQQQFNTDYVKENYKSSNGARWRVPGRPGSNSGLAYYGDSIDEYKRRYQIKSKDNDADWKALVELCRVLNKTPADKLEAALKPMLDIDETLWFLALDNVVQNDDGYWTRASDYSLYRDPKGKFHLGIYDTNESFVPMGGKGGMKGGFGKGFGGGPGGGAYSVDPLIGVNNSSTPLYRLLSVPALRTKYLQHVRTIANEQLDWTRLKPVVDGYRKLIEKEVELDTRRLTTLTAFKEAHADDSAGSRYNLRTFADGRRKYLLNHPDIKNLGAK